MSMRDKDCGGDWVTGEFKTASLTGSNFPGMVDGNEGEREEGLWLYVESRTSGNRSRIEWSSRVEEALSSVVASDGGEEAAASWARNEGGRT
jgi:hypothetical protein